MPGPVSDSYDPEFSTGANADDVRDAIKDIVDQLGKYLGPELKYIVSVAQGPEGKRTKFALSERDMRVIRFGLNRALESI